MSSDRELLDQIINELNLSEDALFPTEAVGVDDPSTLLEFVKDSTNAFITGGQEKAHGLPVIDEEMLLNFFLVGMVVGANFVRRKESK